MDLSALPGGDMIAEGLADLRAGQESAAGLLVLIGAPRLRALGFEIPSLGVDHPEHRLYETLAASDSDSAHTRYNALIRLLVSFERAVECGS
jgi:hypothetical protein